MLYSFAGIFDAVCTLTVPDVLDSPKRGGSNVTVIPRGVSNGNPLTDRLTRALMFAFLSIVTVNVAVSPGVTVCWPGDIDHASPDTVGPTGDGVQAAPGRARHATAASASSFMASLSIGLMPMGGRRTWRAECCLPIN
jgi:hypothetical protein